MGQERVETHKAKSGQEGHPGTLVLKEGPGDEGEGEEEGAREGRQEVPPYGRGLV